MGKMFKNEREKKNHEYEKTYSGEKRGLGLRKKALGFDSVGRDAKRNMDVAADAVNSVAKKGGEILGKVGNVISNAVHDDAFPTEQRRKYLKKKQDDDWKNSDVRKKLLELEGIDPEDDTPTLDKIKAINGIDPKDNRTFRERRNAIKGI
jgi:hypothetical protein